MKLKEIAPSDMKEILNKEDVHPTEIIDDLKRKGYEQIGSGNFSSIFKDPKSSIVVKVSKDEDKCWLKFANLAKKYYRVNKHFPKISRIKTFNFKGDEFFVSFMESLEEGNQQEKQELSDIMNKMLLELEFFGDNDVEDMRIGNFENYMSQKLLKKYNYMNELITFVVILKENHTGECKWDLYPQNIMYRGQTPVIVDPWG